METAGARSNRGKRFGLFGSYQPTFIGPASYTPKPQVNYRPGSGGPYGNNARCRLYV